MNRNNFPTFTAALLATGSLLLPSGALAASVTLTDGNSQANVNLDNSAGMYQWTVDGGNQLNQQWFWYRVGSGLAQPINTISSANILYQDLSTVVAEYANAQLTVDITYILTGGTFGHSDITEAIAIKNNTGSAFNLSFFQYSDFNLLNDPTGDSVSIDGSPGTGFDFVYQSKGPTQIAEAITSPMADRAEADLTFSTRNNLDTVAGYNLNNTDSAGPGDVTWALQWNRLIAGGDTFDLTKDKKLNITAIPEPSTVALVSLALGVWGMARRRQE
jgi:hypothetical protein